MCPQCDEYLVATGETLCPSCREIYSYCDECGEIIDRDDLDEDSLCPDCREPEEDSSENEVEVIEQESA